MPTNQNIFPSSIAFVAVLGFFSFGTFAQSSCTPQWLLANADFPSTSFAINASVIWDQDGDGPLPPRLVVGGNAEQSPGSLTSLRVFNSQTRTWESLDNTNLDTVYALATIKNATGGQDLLVGGNFDAVPGVPGTARLARWNGSNWSSIGNGVSEPSRYVFAIATLPNGDIIVGGSFTGIGGTLITEAIARWDGTNWHSVGGGMGVGVNIVYALKVLPNGDLIAGGNFRTAGNTQVNNIARWDGSTWAALGAGTGSQVNALATMPNGDIIAAGTFRTAGTTPANLIARWNGSAWLPLGTGFVGALMPFVNDLLVLPDGRLLAGGFFDNAGGVPTQAAAIWNGANWSSIGAYASPNYVNTFTQMPDGWTFLGGGFYGARPVSTASVARWGCPACDDIDFNNNTVFPEDADVIDFFNVLAGAECAACNDIDFNNNGVFPEDADVIDFFNVLAGGTCP